MEYLLFLEDLSKSELKLNSSHIDLCKSYLHEKDFEIEGYLGVGAFGAVMLARDVT